MNKLTREDFTRLDQIDPLAEVRDEFTLPQDLIYFDHQFYLPDQPT